MSGITVRELIASLSGLDPEMPVHAEGCDCINPVTAVSVESKTYVLIQVDAR